MSSASKSDRMASISSAEVAISVRRSNVALADVAGSSAIGTAKRFLHSFSHRGGGARRLSELTKSSAACCCSTPMGGGVVMATSDPFKISRAELHRRFDLADAAERPRKIAMQHSRTGTIG
jgi:hypothetical protein